ncbi:hypothetical protein M0804_008272 [Polistes exclamans]|nr:hypothetical protein M0804_008272 [Polistes exclamans]
MVMRGVTGKRGEGLISYRISVEFGGQAWLAAKMVMQTLQQPQRLGFDRITFPWYSLFAFPLGSFLLHW